MKNKRTKLFAVVFVAVLSLFVMAFAAQAAFLGDVVDPQNKTVTSDDARAILRVSVNLSTFDDALVPVADIDGSGDITASDARSALRISVNLEYKRPLYIEGEVTKKPTCTEKGVQQMLSTEKGYTALDGKEFPDEYNVDIPALGHDWEILSETKPTNKWGEEGNGSITKKCRRCGEKITVSTDHDWVPATCTEDGYCRDCHMKGQPALGHSTSFGVCDRCGKYINNIPEVTKAVKQNLEDGFKKVNEASDIINEGVYASSLKTYAPKAKPVYQEALALYTAASETCAEHTELADIKVKIDAIIDHINAILAQIDIIIAAPQVDMSNLNEYITPIVDAGNNINKIQQTEIARVIKHW